MKHTSFLRKLTAAVLSCTLCCTGMTVPAFSAEETEELPARYDLRDEGAMTSVKSQYGGTCVMFACFAAIESNMIKKGLADSSLDLAEQHFSWFTHGKAGPDDPDDPLAGDWEQDGLNGYTHGTSFWKLTGTLASWTGVVPASQIPDCEQFVEIDESYRYADIAHLQNARLFDMEDTEDIKRAIMEKGGMHIGYFSIGKPNHYSEYGGYYQTDLMGTEEDDSSKLDGGGHAVCLCGWDDNFPKEHFLETPPGDGAWICKNSWGPNSTACADGYIYISYYDRSLSNAMQFDMEPADNYDSIYQRCGSMRAAYTISNRGWVYANLYTAKKDENLTAVSIVTHEADLPYEISIYALKDGYQDPRDGELLAQISGTEHYAGYHTYPLNTSCTVTAGQKFSAVVKTGIHPSTTIFMDKNPDHSGTSFYLLYNENGESAWHDSTAQDNHGNVLVKVFTKDGTAVNEEKYPDALYRKAVSEQYDENSDLVITDKERTEAEAFIRGDVNCDGKVNAVDLSLLKQVLRGSERTDLCLIAGDWNEDQTVNAEDAAGICDFLLQREA